MFRLIDHALVQHYLGMLRDEKTVDGGRHRPFASIGMQLSRLLIAEAVRRYVVPDVGDVRTPLGVHASTRRIDESRLIGISIERAGNIMLEAFSEALPNAAFGSVKIHRSHTPPFDPIDDGGHTFPDHLAGKSVLLLDPMLATARSACHVVRMLKQRAVSTIVFIGWVGCNEGVNRLQKEHPDVDIILAAVDPVLNDQAYIVPGLGDAGDRIYGSRGSGEGE